MTVGKYNEDPETIKVTVRQDSRTKVWVARCSKDGATAPGETKTKAVQALDAKHFLSAHPNADKKIR